MGILVVQTAFLGDVVLTTPLLDALAATHGPVDIVTTPAAAALVATHPSVRAVITHDKHGSERGPGGVFRLARRLRAGGYKTAYLPHQSWRSGLVTLLARIPERVGFRGAAAQLSYTRRIDPPSDCHETERLLALSPVGGDATPTLGVTEADRELADRWLVEHGIAAGFVALAPGSVWGTKRWGGYPELAAAIEGQVVVIGGDDDRELASEIENASPDRAVSAAGELPLMVTAALLARATALVTNDSLPLHLAQATGTPTVALFGPTVPRFGFGPRGTRDGIVELGGLDCRPCSLHGPMECPLGHHSCMADITTDRVVTALQQTLTA